MLKPAIATSASFLVMTPIIPFHLPFISTPQWAYGCKNWVLRNESGNASTRLVEGKPKLKILQNLVLKYARSGQGSGRYVGVHYAVRKVTLFRGQSE
jgi:hypothetical protein